MLPNGALLVERASHLLRCSTDGSVRYRNTSATQGSEQSTKKKRTVEHGTNSAVLGEHACTSTRRLFAFGRLRRNQSACFRVVDVLVVTYRLFDRFVDTACHLVLLHGRIRTLLKGLCCGVAVHFRVYDYGTKLSEEDCSNNVIHVTGFWQIERIVGNEKWSFKLLGGG